MADRSPQSATTTGAYQCSRCQRTFNRLDHLSRHVRIHTKEKPYTCPVCRKSFARADLLKRHACRHASASGILPTAARSSLDKPSRVSQACAVCAASKLKCSEQKPCLRCVQRGVVCRWDGLDLKWTAFQASGGLQSPSPTTPEQDQDQTIDLTANESSPNDTSSAFESPQSSKTPVA